MPRITCTKKARSIKPHKRLCGAVSVGFVEGHTMLDLSYEEDSKADVDQTLS